ncbi:MAG: alkyl hydroperoxide reductase, partial [Rhodocyclales bacterium]|nr:alkyl hydroperoxide reductase [Rhodocyclales bacterium]
MLDANIQEQLKAYLERLEQPIQLITSLDDSGNSEQMRELVNEIAALSDKI